MSPTREVVRPVPQFDDGPDVPYGKLKPGPGRSAVEVAEHQRARVHRAMITLAAERGYEAVTVRELARRAGISTRSFYALFQGKEDCFVRTHELIIRRMARQISSAQAGESDWVERLRLAFAAFAREVAHEPEAARLTLIAAYTAGPNALERARRAELTFEAVLAESFSRAPDGVVLPPLVIKGLVAGIAQVTRARLLAGDEQGLPAIADDLLEWALSFRCEAVATASQLEVSSKPGTVPGTVPSSKERDGARAPSGDRALILSVVAKLAARDGHGALSGDNIRSATGVSKRSFAKYFDSVEASLIAASEVRIDEALRRAREAQALGATDAGGLYQAIFALCQQVARDRTLARLAFGEVAMANAKDCLHVYNHLLRRLVDLIGGACSSAEARGDLALEASAAGIWSVLHHHVSTGRACQAPQTAAVLTYFALAQTIGAKAIESAILAELHLSAEQQRVTANPPHRAIQAERPDRAMRRSIVGAH